MPSVFEKIQNEESYLKIRILSICALASTYIFYYFMKTLAVEHIDSMLARNIIAVMAIVCFAFSFKKNLPFRYRRYLVSIISFSYIITYMYLLHLNQWSVFHRWSYFVVIAIMATVNSTWQDYIYTAVLAVVVPVLLCYWSPLSHVELIHFHATNIVVFLVIGVTVRANFQYRAQVINLTDNLIQSSKMIALGEISAGVAHEINNPLAIIIGGKDQIDFFMSESPQNSNMIRSSLEKMQRAAMRIARIVQGLHDFSQGDNNEVFQKIVLQDVIRDAVKLCAQKFKVSKVKLIEHLPTEPIYCLGQPAQLTQLVSNLLNNAFDASSKNAAPQVQIKMIHSQTEAFISVIDNGPGVAAEIETQIMQPFFTTKPIGQGTGLGLSISLGIAKSNQGELQLDKPSLPCSFTLKLPIIKA